LGILNFCYCWLYTWDCVFFPTLGYTFPWTSIQIFKDSNRATFSDSNGT
jgi:hypothetical protein